ncbi:hypothetical protein [Streptosporangium lutulentum]|uniref:Uncharacterized protein n=1 Tax=Streptosporangium lutulentum TaxID=1461250 RepID=A0ABT9QP77_9ACTN|nr:hypothetical protein [Streptosporangium lutulentum]MDP9848551.1 hypothetical protein [Streptosporangium lutulentum]
MTETGQATDTRTTGTGGTTAMSPAALFRGLVDDAGLFPPTSLPMAEALERHRKDLAGNNPVLAHRFLCPAGRLPELRAHLTFPIRLGLILDTPDVPPLDDLAVELVEVRQPPGESPDAVSGRLAPLLPGGARLFVEVPPGNHASPPHDDPRPDPDSPPRDTAQPGLNSPPLDTAPPDPDSPPHDASGPGLKFRCGGLTADAFPTAHDLGAAIAHCVKHGIPFKATAGLHNAVRHFDPALGVDRHGFLNLVLAVCAAVEGRDPVPVLKLTDVGELVRLARAVPEDTAEHARKLLVSYGSCSTNTPIEDLAALGLIAREPSEAVGPDIRNQRETATSIDTTEENT